MSGEVCEYGRLAELDGFLLALRGEPGALASPREGSNAALSLENAVYSGIRMLKLVVASLQAPEVVVNLTSNIVWCQGAPLTLEVH